MSDSKFPLMFSHFIGIHNPIKDLLDFIIIKSKELLL